MAFDDATDTLPEATGWWGPLAGSDQAERAGDADVRWLQETLNRVANAGLAVDGNAGPATRAAVRSFQSAHGLTPDGIVGERTLAALRTALAGAGPAPGPGPASGTPVCTGLPERQTLDRFAFGQHRVPPQHQPRIDAIAACLLASLNSPTPIDGLSVVGHTDPVGGEPANLALGQRRAEAVVDAIIASLQRQSGGGHYNFVFTPSSLGEDRPVPGDPALSRRVEIITPFAYPRPAPPRPVPPRPVPPGPRRDIDPPRWGPILARAHGPQSVIRSGNAIRHLVDAENPAHAALAGYPPMVEAIRAARGGNAFIYLLGWVCVDDFDMVTCDPSTKLRRLLTDAAARGVQIRALLWEQSRFFPESRRTTHEAADHINAIPGALAVLDQHAFTVLGSHHQKVLVVGDGEGLIGFTGGLDVNSDRVLPTKVVCPPPGILTAPGGGTEVDTESGSGSGSGGLGSPLHDIHCRVEGPAAYDLLQTFIRRWDNSPVVRARVQGPGSWMMGPVAPLRGRTTPVPAPIAAPVPPARGSIAGTCSIAVGRTFNPHSGTGMARERDIKSMLLAAIPRARRFIYMEEQYLINLEAARALRAALANIEHLTILIAGSDVNTDTECIWTYRKEFVDVLSRGLSAQDAAKVRIFQLVTPPIPATPPACSTRGRTFTPTFGRHTYVHAKAWVFDDELAVIGSANCNRRGWEHDTELDAFIFDDRVPTVGTQSFAQRMRMDMWAEHLDLPAARLEDGVASASHWLRAPTTARVMRYCPNDVDDDGITCSWRKDNITDPSAP